jgi:hypothetical protein
VFALYVGLLLMINTTGSYGHLGWLSVVQSARYNIFERRSFFFRFNSPKQHSLLDDSVLSLIGLQRLQSFTLWWHVLPNFRHWLLDVACVVIVASPYVVASLIPMHDTYPVEMPQWLVSWFADCAWLYGRLERHVVLGRYVKFASVTRTRTELVIEATDGAGKRADWPFRYKPTHIDARPPISVWLMPGVDWQCWFLGLRPEQPPWLTTLLSLALHGDRDVLALLGPCPYASLDDVVSLRVALYDYCYRGCEPTPDDARFERGRYWSRRFLGYLRGSIRRRQTSSVGDDDSDVDEFAQFELDDDEEESD